MAAALLEGLNSALKEPFWRCLLAGGWTNKCTEKASFNGSEVRALEVATAD